MGKNLQSIYILIISEEEKTETGIDGWYLGLPSWAKDNDLKQLDLKYKTTMCKDWVEARKRKDRIYLIIFLAPKGADMHWGCPRGRACLFAHGYKDLSDEGKRHYIDTEKVEREQKRAEKYIFKYIIEKRII